MSDDGYLTSFTCLNFAPRFLSAFIISKVSVERAMGRALLLDGKKKYHKRIERRKRGLRKNKWPRHSWHRELPKLPTRSNERVSFHTSLCSNRRTSLQLLNPLFPKHFFSHRHVSRKSLIGNDCA